MKATPKQLAFLGVFSLTVLITCVVVGYRAVAPTPRGRTASSSRALSEARNSSSLTSRQPTGWRSSYRSSSFSSASSAEPGNPPGSDSAGIGGEKARLASGRYGSSGASRPAPTLNNPKLVTYSLDDYLTIAERDLFKPITSPPRPKPASAQGPLPVPKEFPRIPAPVVIPNGNSNPSVPSTPPTPPPPPTPSTPPPAPSAPGSPQDIAVTGFVQSPEGWSILIENVATQEARLVELGEEEFGYRIQSIDVAKKRVILEKDGQQLQLKIGDNKKEVRPEKKAPEAAPPGSGAPGNRGAPAFGGGAPGFNFGGGAPGFNMGNNPWGQMSPDAMQRFQNWQRRRGGGRNQSG